MDTLLSPVGAWFAAAWLVVVAVQLADLGTARFDFRRLARGSRTLVRLHAVAWVVPLAAIVIIALWVGLDYAATLLFTDSALISGILLCAILVVVLVGGWLVITVAATKPAVDSYRAIRDELVDVAGTRVQQERLDEMQARISGLDADDRDVPAASSRRSSLEWVVRRPQRLAAILAAVALLVVIATTSPDSDARGWLVLAAVGAVVLSSVLAVAGARASLTLIAAVRDAQIEYRGEAVHLLAEAQKTSKKPVAGLGDRVTRALQILREQQS